MTTTQYPEPLTVNSQQEIEWSPEPDCPPIISSCLNTCSTNTLPRVITLEPSPNGFSHIEESATPMLNLKEPPNDIISRRLNDVFLPSPLMRHKPDIIVDDDVFSEKNERRDDKENENLVDWAFNMYVPACKRLLESCNTNPVDFQQIQVYLRLLTNTITFFCNEHQQLQNQHSRGLSPSKSFTGMDEWIDK